ncbi:MAG: ABC transporter ATP-binding protein [Opitutae bacterium]|jgi:putative ABC transport system ATP-binding protein|nr:ABC transporter ATP-binding protein [Opitutae bacterium]MBT4665765.1 ABC transporter ATP-binding protein [Opitutae bacterium]MBT5910859.1 ABC transporter ATP-binding protein [Opitutae bacterium]MBT6852242.1 ABC transporter ATP-binding protein [Opitutae bacterium]MBT7742883.1 ABC transporter ATP-binding protein [Opitutae bacterium]
MNILLRLNQVSKSFEQGGQKIKVLDHLDFIVERGETISILGQSGSGKSTLLSLLAGLDHPDKGTVEVKGEDLAKLSQDQLSKFRSKNLGIVFQQYHLMSNLTALENVGIPLELQGKSDFTGPAMLALDQVGLSDRLNHFPSQLSGGECQRVALARAIVSEPNFILADEPSGNLDRKTGGDIMDLLFRLCREKEQSLILVTHNRELAQSCNRTLVLRDGQLNIYAENNSD